MVINHYNGDIMTSSLTLPGSGFHLPRRKHSLHDVLDWDRPEPTAQSDTLQRIVDIVKRTGKDFLFFNYKFHLNLYKFLMFIYILNFFKKVKILNKYINNKRLK